jgi:hypothetical protein
MFGGMQVKVSDRVPETKSEKYMKRLTMGEQWKRWGLNLWRYKEEEEATRTVKAPHQVFMFGHQIVCNPSTYAMIKNISA